MVQLAQQWLSTYKTRRNPVVVQSKRLMSPLVLGIQWNPKEVGSNAEGAFFHILWTGGHQKVWPRLKVALPSNHLVKSQVYPATLVVLNGLLQLCSCWF